jgi:hypothetical protein
MTLDLQLRAFLLGTKFGTDASLAGDQKRVMHSTKIVAAYSQ